MAVWSQRKGVRFLTIFLFGAFINGSLTLTCLECNNVSSLQDCTRFKECEPDEECKLVECNKDVFGTTRSATTYPAAYDLKANHIRFKRDLVVCTQCCYNDTCNINGCGSSYYDERETTLHCFSQDKVTTNETVQTVLRCQSNEVCFHTAKIFVGSYGYTLGCLSKRMCDFLAETAKNQGTELATNCCDTPLCNANPFSQKLDMTILTQHLACPTALVKTSTIAATSSVMTSISTKTSATKAYTATQSTRSPTIVFPIQFQRSCVTCSGPPDMCEQVFYYYEEVCTPPDIYCINHVINAVNGSRTVTRGCGSLDTCRSQWWNITRLSDRCMRLRDDVRLYEDFECTYCCTTEDCNIPLHPQSDSLYKE